MPAETFSKPLEAMLENQCDFEYYVQTSDTFSKTSKTRICHVTISSQGVYNSDAVLMVFTIRNQSGKWKIHSEGAKRMDPGATVPLRNTAIALAKRNRWKFASIALAGEDVPSGDIISQYVVSMESYSYGSETVYDLTNNLREIRENGCPDFYRCSATVNGNAYSFAFIKKEKIIEYLTVMDNRSYGDEDRLSTVEKLSPEWFKQQSIKYEKFDDESNALYEKFQSLYGPDKLAALNDDELLESIFLGKKDGNLCHALEYDGDYQRFGSIAGGNAYNKYNLYYSRSDEQWMALYGEGGVRTVTEEEALSIGKSIRDALVLGAKIISEWDTFATASDYSKLYEKLNSAIPQYINKIWFLKYYHMIFPQFLTCYYSSTLQKHILYNLNIMPSDSPFVSMGQISTFVSQCGISNIVFGQIAAEFIGPQKTFYRIGTGENGEYFDGWKNGGYVAIGWNGLGDLTQIYQDGGDVKARIVEGLKDGWNYDNRLASRKYGEINNFYSTVADKSFVVAMCGQKVLAIGEFSGGYYYDDTKEYAHCRPVRWLRFPGEGTTLPAESEGKLTTFCELRNSENLLYLWSLIWKRDEATDVTPGLPENEVLPIKLPTGYKSEYPRNRILFGAPGTGKSFTLNTERRDLLYGDKHADEGNLDLCLYGEYERVTFHPDYSYANFVGTYKPVPNKDSDGKDAITYAYVPGPFMRTYVKALKNSRTEDPKPYLLIIEEINRANVAAVFGDVFQLLDRDENDVSEYPIQASEDIKKYLAQELGGHPDDYAEIRIPDNMFIWATMNSADQGVFPMDTAFKRRWDFTYLGIDDSESQIVGKKVILGQGEYRRIVEWNALRKAINTELLSYKVNEDKLMGPYFLSPKIVPANAEIDATVFSRVFKNKVIMYLFDDAAKQKRASLFSGCEEKAKNQYSKICREFDLKGVYIFCETISSQFIDGAPEDQE